MHRISFCMGGYISEGRLFQGFGKAFFAGLLMEFSIGFRV